MTAIIKNKKGKALFIALNVVLSVVAIAFLMGMAGGAATEVSLGRPLASRDVGALDAPTNSPGIGAGAPEKVSVTQGGLDKLSKVQQKQIIDAGFPVGRTGVDANALYNAGVPLETITAAASAFGFEIPKGAPSPLGNVDFGQYGAGLGDHLVAGAMWVGAAYVAGQLIGSMIGLSGENTNALSYALMGGTAVAYTISQTNFLGLGGGLWPYAIGLGVAAIIFLLLYKDVTYETVTFSCMPWQAPIGSNDCQKCNKDELPCSEYRCRALGQNCELVNSGTNGQEMCVSVRPNDVEPPVITPDPKALTTGYKYADVKSSPPGPGFRITSNTSDGCVKAFTPLKFGITTGDSTTGEPSQCRIDFNHTTNFDDMAYWMGGSNLFAYNHTEQFSLPGPANTKNASLILQNDGKWSFFIRCRDKNGNTNEAEYEARFCVDPSPDTIAPVVSATSITTGSCVAENQQSANVDFYISEPSECRWSKQDQAYDSMNNTMSCSTELYQINAMQTYTCKSTLTGIGKTDTPFYVRCKDLPGRAENERNVNGQSYTFSLRGSDRLKMKNIAPNGTVFGGTRPAGINITVETSFGCDGGKAMCFYSSTDRDDQYIKFFETDSAFHEQRLDLAEGTYNYYVKCVDLGGNIVKNSTTFRVDIETGAPSVARVYKEESVLKIVTTRNSDCAYTFDSCDFMFQEGTVMPTPGTKIHYAEWFKDKTYYIKCRDEFRNEPADCSIIVKPTEI